MLYFMRFQGVGHNLTRTLLNIVKHPSRSHLSQRSFIYFGFLCWWLRLAHLAQAAATGAFKPAKRSYPTSEVGSRNREDPMPEGRRPRGVTPRPRSGAAAENARLQWCRNSQEELPHVRGQGQRPRGATPSPRSRGCAGAGGPRGTIPHSRSEGAVVRRYPLSKVRSNGCALLEQPGRDTPRAR